MEEYHLLLPRLVGHLWAARTVRNEIRYERDETVREHMSTVDTEHEHGRAIIL